MKVSFFLIVSLLLMSVGVNMANAEMLKDNGLRQKLVKRSPGCGRRSCPCCPGYTCVSGRCYGH
uniref:CRP-I 2 n=1 Tax=Mytilus galloprovincialis TaxID=29158 RepID=A0A0A7ACM5_MYTGA|nr:CRP-I 2 [Mytilus galloprovincialis]